jgi:hypothetical protein
VYVTDVYNLFRSYIDESDTTFISDLQAQLALRGAYDTVREKIAQLSPMSIIERQSYTVSNATSLSLSQVVPRILGKTVDAPRLLRLQGVFYLNPSTMEITQELTGVGSLQELYNSSIGTSGLGYGQPAYCFIKDALFFPGPVTKTVGVFYVPYPSKPENATGIDWSKTAPADTEYIDDFPQFHKLIALTAAKEYYSVRDGGDNPQLLRELSAIESDMERFFITRTPQNMRVNLVW